MGLLAMIKKENQTPAVEDRAKELADFVEKMDAELQQDWSRRLYGDGVYSGYKVLREFYKGQQWSYKKDDGGTMRTYNYCFTIVENMTAFLTNEPPQMSCPARDITDTVERSLAEGRTKLLDAIHEINSLPLVFQRAVRCGSLNGDSYIFGAIPVFETDDEGKRIFKAIRYYNVERPETIRPLWKDDNYNEMSGFIKQYRISVERAKKLFAKEVKKGFQITEDYDSQNPDPKVTVPMTTIKEYWDDKEYLLMFCSGGKNKPVDYVKHDWGFLPLHFVPNIHLPGEPRGTSDLEHELDPQQEYNERTSDLADILKEISQPAYWGKNIDNVTEIKSGKAVIYNLGDDGELNAMPKSGQTFPMDSYTEDRKNDMIALSGLNQVLYPGSQTLQATGRALSVIMQGVNNKISLRKEWWIKAFKDLNMSILFHAEQHIKNAKLLIGGFYQTDVFISSVLLRSVSDEINKFQSKVQSLTTTQKNVGIQNPSEEQKLMKEELQDEILATEIAKQPGLLHQILAERIAQMNQTGGMASVGQAGINGAPAGIANESENEEGMRPQSGRGVASPVSPEGMINQRNARAGAPTKIKK